MNKLLPLLLFVVFISCSGKKPADLVITGGTIYTMDASQPVVEAVVVNEDTIVFAGTAKAAAEWIGDNTNVIELQGKTMVPGFIEGHGHFMGVGYNELDLDLSGVKTFDEIVERVRIAASKAKPGEWILGRGWHQDKWDVKPADMVKGYPSHAQLSAVSPDNPVFLSHASGHMSLANAKAMEIAGVNQLSKESLNKFSDEGGEIIRDANGNPTGLFNENAEDVIAKFIPANDSERMTKAFELATQTCLKNGITGFHDAGVGREVINFYKSQYALGKFGLRMYVMVTGWDRDLVHEWFKKGPEVDPKHWLTIRSIKLNCDGALGSRGAWLLEPYTDRPDFYGMATLSMDTVLATSRDALKAGFQVCSHAIGDRANREILDRYEMAMKENPDVKDSRFRIEHAQHLNPTDIPRFAKLGVIPAMQAIHMASDRPWAIDRLGEKRIKEGAYMWQSLLKSGARIVNGTDAPVEPVNPIPSFYASVTRMTLKGEPEGGYEPEEKMTREQALRSYTLDAAYGAFEEKFKGSIEKGKLADFAILSKDIMTIPDKEILSAEVLTTIVGGKVVYEKK
ncbi:MAG TPA: amidohydrolase [Cyclobacteriaceae bacterium]|nr:amidohydrolase [Cyclobacteriaceae bacterium]HMV10655.1 amidohydrolase [Cyclobacteriaceae bacterium]HMV91647.1 amidohydrolase [Cyclobacteriaceae bacterium]HMX02516.1 amidohydrolase [Cyclobacteriaceae bacterium]HMX52244.1 amidohydrolase [Cyclobacteriaceae bacterium]